MARLGLLDVIEILDPKSGTGWVQLRSPSAIEWFGSLVNETKSGRSHKKRSWTSVALEYIETPFSSSGTKATVSDETAEYEVQQILDSRIRRSKAEYLVWWKHFKKEEASWEPVANLCNSQDHIQAFSYRAMQAQEAPRETGRVKTTSKKTTARKATKPCSLIAKMSNEVKQLLYTTYSYRSLSWFDDY